MRASSVHTAILELLSERAPQHLTAAEIYEQIRGRLPAVNPSTVYRTLDRAAKAGEISVSDVGSGAAVYEALTDGLHHHLVCQGCGQTISLSHAEIRPLFTALEAAHDYHILTNHLVLFGLCPGCQAKSNLKEDDPGA